jgi:transposase
MTKLSDVDPDDLRAALETVNSAKAAMRLMVALDYLDGEGVDEMSDRYGIPRSTIYSWLTRFEERSVTEAIEDRERPGRPRELDDDELAALAERLSEPPREADFDADEWTPAMLQRHIERSHGVSYSLGHARRLLRELADG